MGAAGPHPTPPNGRDRIELLMSRCRACKTQKWRSDPCPNADCPRNNTTTIRLKSRTLPITATAKHGFHGLNTTTTQLVSDYDAPIRARTWRAIA